MLGFLEVLLTLLTTLINACFPCSCGHSPESNEEKTKRRRRYSITETTTTTHTTTIEKSGSSPNIAENLKSLEKIKEINEK